MTDLEPYIRWLASYFRVPGMDRDDLAQEARLAAWLAPAGAEKTAARRRILDLLKASQRLKRPQLTYLTDSHELAGSDVVDIVAARETLRRIVSAPLTAHERSALSRTLRGEPIREKAAQGALARARRKLAA